ncbi:MAG: S4 domain-containing protein, partial [candidate division Zixibacteria bacterium]
FGKVMSIADEQIYSYFELATDVTLEELKKIKQKLNKPDVNPMVIKKELGQRLVDMYHPAGSGQSAREEFERVFSKKQLPQDMPELTLEELKGFGLKDDKVYLVHLMSKTKMVKSNNEARKLILAGAVTIDGEKIDNPDFEFSVDKEMVLKVGKRRYLKLLG